MTEFTQAAKPRGSPTVSIVIPVYNRVRYLGATIQGILTQTFGQWELIVVDDGSQEDVYGFVAQYDDARIRFVRQENKGNAVARNTGIQQAAGEYIVCLDSDDVWHPDFLQKCVDRLNADIEVDVVYSQVQSIGADGQPLPQPVSPKPCSGDLLPYLLLGYPILPSSAMVRRVRFDQWGAYTPGLDDWELWLRWAAHGCRFACIEQPLLHYRIHDQNFNLDFDSRRAAHFAMLDRFYSQERLPEIALRLHKHAYANQHFHFAMLAWQVGRMSDGVAEMAKAVLGHTAYLADLDFFTRIACAHQGRLDAGTVRGLNLTTAEATLVESLDAIFAMEELPQDIICRRRVAYAWAYFALARLAYSIPHDMAQARRFLWHAIRSWPFIIVRSDLMLWQIRVLLGYRRVQAMKNVWQVEKPYDYR